VPTASVAIRGPSGLLQSWFCPRQFSTGSFEVCITLCKVCDVETNMSFSCYSDWLSFETGSTQADRVSGRALLNQQSSVQEMAVQFGLQG